jgi:hypothetical protein
MTPSSEPVRDDGAGRSEVVHPAPRRSTAVARGRLARPVELERTWTPDREAQLAAPRGMQSLDRLEQALVFALHEVHGHGPTEEKTDGEHG